MFLLIASARLLENPDFMATTIPVRWFNTISATAISGLSPVALASLAHCFQLFLV